MLIETLQRGCARDAMQDFREMKKLNDDDSKGKICEQEITNIREIHSRENKRDPKRTILFRGGPLSSRWSRHMTLNETYRALSLFTLRY